MGPNIFDLKLTRLAHLISFENLFLPRQDVVKMPSFHFLAKFCTICCRNHFQVGRAPENLKMSWAIILRMHHDATSHFSWSLQLVENTASPLVEHHHHLQDAFRQLHHAHGELSPSSSTPHQWQMQKSTISTIINIETTII